MALDATFTVDAAAIPTDGTAATTSYSTSVALAFTSLTDAHTFEWTCMGTSDYTNVSAPTITDGGAPLGSTASFTFPADPGTGYGASVRIRGRQYNAAGQYDDCYAIIGVPGPSGICPLVAGEKLDRHPQDGWIHVINAAAGGASSRYLLDEDGDIILYAEDSPSALPSSPTTTIWNSTNGLAMVTHGGAIIQFPGVINNLTAGDAGLWPCISRELQSSASGWLEWDVGKGALLPYHGTSPSDDYVMGYQFMALSQVSELTGTGMVYRCGSINVRSGTTYVNQADLPLATADQLGANADDIEVIIDGTDGWTFRVDVQSSYTTDWLYVVSGIALYAP